MTTPTIQTGLRMARRSAVLLMVTLWALLSSVQPLGAQQAPPPPPPPVFPTAPPAAPSRPVTHVTSRAQTGTRSVATAAPTTVPDTTTSTDTTTTTVPPTTTTLAEALARPPITTVRDHIPAWLLVLTALSGIANLAILGSWLNTRYR